MSTVHPASPLAVSDHAIDAHPAGLTERELADFRDCCRRLQSPTPRTRLQAAERLGDFGTMAAAPLRQALVDLDAEVQVAAVGSIAKIGGPEGHNLLLAALRSDTAKVRVAAAQMLGEIGDAEDLSPLIEAYNRSYLGRSARRQRQAGLFILGLVTIVAVGISTWISAEHLYSALPFAQALCWTVVWSLVSLRAREHSAPILAALLQVAERNPRADLHRLIPELQAVARDRIQYQPSTRSASRQAIRRIEVLTAALHDLPVPVSAPQPDATALPVPAAAADVDSAPLRRRVDP